VPQLDRVAIRTGQLRQINQSSNVDEIQAVC
jgi:hypothetical protein